MEDRYNGDIAKLNSVCGTSFDSFQVLKESGTLDYPVWMKNYKNGYTAMPGAAGSQAIFDDGQALLGEIIEHTYQVAHEAVRKHDQNHLIFGSYVKDAAMLPQHWERIAHYIDVIAPQHVSQVFPIGPVADALDKPVLISDQRSGRNGDRKRRESLRFVRRVGWRLLNDLLGKPSQPHQQHQTAS